jgi:hypothetical protein
MVTDDDGMPTSMLDLAKVQFDATRLMYQMAAAGDDAELDRIGTRWAEEYDPGAFGLLAGAALSLMTRCVLQPLLQVLEELRPDTGFRARIAEARDHAEQTLGGGR